MHYIGLLALILVWVVGGCFAAILIWGTVKAMKKNGVTEKQAFKRLSEKYPATPNQIEEVLDRRYAYIIACMRDDSNGKE